MMRCARRGVERFTFLLLWAHQYYYLDRSERVKTIAMSVGGRHGDGTSLEAARILGAQETLDKPVDTLTLSIGLMARGVFYIQKTISLDALTRTVRQILNSSGEPSVKIRNLQKGEMVDGHDIKEHNFVEPGLCC